MAAIGFSAGDIALALKFVYQISKSFRDSGGASSEYQEVLRYLEGLLLTLQQLQNLDASATDPSVVKAIQALSASCAAPIHEFIEGIKKFETSLGVAANRGKLKAGFQRAQWSLFVSEKVEKLKGRINGQMQPIHLLLESQTLTDVSRQNVRSEQIYQQVTSQAAQLHEQACLNVQLINAINLLSSSLSKKPENESAGKLTNASLPVNRAELGISSNSKSDKTVVGASSISPAEAFVSPGDCAPMNDVHLMTQELVAFVCQLFRCCHTLFRYVMALSPQCFLLLQVFGKLLPRAPSMLLDDNIHFEDVLGRSHSLQYTYFRHWKVFESLLCESFRGFPGENDVLNQRYCILDALQQGKSISKGDWGMAVGPGKRIVMSIVTRFSISSSTCPVPLCDGKIGGADEASIKKCPACMVELYSTGSSPHTTRLELSKQAQLPPQPLPNAPESSAGADRDGGEVSYIDTKQLDIATGRHDQASELSFFKRIHVSTNAGRLEQDTYADNQESHSSNSSWDPLDDLELVEARVTGLTWTTIARKHIKKTPDACKERHEQLLMKLKALPVGYSHTYCHCYVLQSRDPGDHGAKQASSIFNWERITITPIPIDEHQAVGLTLDELLGFSNTSPSQRRPHAVLASMTDALDEIDFDPRYRHSFVRMLSPSDESFIPLSSIYTDAMNDGQSIAVFKRELQPDMLEMGRTKRSTDMSLQLSRIRFAEPTMRIGYARALEKAWESAQSATSTRPPRKISMARGFDHQLFSSSPRPRGRP